MTIAKELKQKAFDLKFNLECAIVDETWFPPLHKQIAHKFPNTEILESQKQKLANDQTFIYLIKDFRSGFYKIGYSKNPRYRESTLQSEQPLIELVTAWLGTPEDEYKIHKEFNNFRIRGEWFDLREDALMFLFLWFAPHEIYGQGMSFLTHYELLKHVRNVQNGTGN